MNHPFTLVPHDRIRNVDGHATGHLREFTCRSAFQPIVSPALMRMVGMEALLRVERAGVAIDTTRFFANLDSDAVVESCRLARAIHVLNVPETPQGNEWLFLNVHPESIRQRRASAGSLVNELGALGMAPGRIVLEIVESAPLSDDELADFVSEYRGAGFRIAIDDFGAGASNYDRVLSVHPDIIKLDRSLIANASASSRARRLFPHMVALLREAGSLVLVEGIETEEQAHIAIDADAELLQGYFFARPGPQLPDQTLQRSRMAALMAPANSGVMRQRPAEEKLRSRFLDAWTRFRDGTQLDLIAQDIEEPQVTRLYVIDSKGFQIGDTALTRHALRGISHPLSNAKGACWARRHYYRRANEQPGRIQMTRPYLSLTEQRLCVTYSCATSHKEHGACVVCMDVLIDG
jgi:EAL domain-containing protein (putative c-di-GMP-specific phosphodiesterase class I)